VKVYWTRPRRHRAATDGREFEPTGIIGRRKPAALSRIRSASGDGPLPSSHIDRNFDPENLIEVRPFCSPLALLCDPDAMLLVSCAGCASVGAYKRIARQCVREERYRNA